MVFLSGNPLIDHVSFKVRDLKGRPGKFLFSGNFLLGEMDLKLLIVHHNLLNRQGICQFKGDILRQSVSFRSGLFLQGIDPGRKSLNDMGLLLGYPGFNDLSFGIT